jgi:glycine betaine catabolism A
MLELRGAMSEIVEPTLPRDAYFSADHYQRECEALFYREWFYVGRSEALPDSGDYLHMMVADESILVVRTRGGDLRAFYNVCRHRGSRLSSVDPVPVPTDRAQASGEFRGVIMCPYHAWCYELSGEVRNAPYLSDAEGFDEANFALHPVSVETWGGFIFVNLTPAEASERGYSLAEQLGSIPDRVKNYPLADLRNGKRLVYQVAANWKVIVENYNECYHCGPVHPELCRIVPAFKKNGGSGLEWEDGIPHAEGMTTFTLSGMTTRAPFPGLSEAEKVRHKGELIYPNMLMSMAADHVAVFMLLPNGPEHTTIVCDFLFHPSEMASDSYDPSDAVEFWDLVNRQDWAVCENVQNGMRSRMFKHGYYAPMEDLSADIRRYLREKLGES